MRHDTRCIRMLGLNAPSKKAYFTFGRDLRPKVGVSLVVKANVKITAERLDYYIEIMNCKRSFGSNRVKVGRRQLYGISSPQPRVRVLWTEIFEKISVASTRMHLMLTLRTQMYVLVRFHLHKCGT